MSVPLGPVVPGAVCCHADNSDPQTVLDGAIHRQGCEKKKVSRHVLREFKHFVFRKMRSLFRPLGKEGILGFEEFLASTSYTEREKAELREARATSDKYAPGHVPRKYFASKCFAKDEFYDEFKQSRGICGRSLLVRARYGPLISSVEKEAYACRFFVKHMSPRERALMIKERLCRAGRILENDYSTFEASFSPELIDACEVQFLRYMLCHAVDPALLDEMVGDMLGLPNIMRYKWFTLVMRGVRKSGDSHTSLANGLTNLMIFLFVADRSGLAEGDYDILVEGDDSIAWLAYASRFEFSNIARQLGFEVKQTWARMANEGSFCQLKFHESGVVVRSPWKVIAKLGWSKANHVSFNQRHLTDLFKAKVLSLGNECGECPILWAVVRGQLDRLRAHRVDAKFVRQHLPLYERAVLDLTDPVVREPSLAVRVFFEEMYRIPVSEQIILEEFFLSGPVVFDHPLVLDRMPREWQRMAEFIVW